MFDTYMEQAHWRSYEIPSVIRRFVQRIAQKPFIEILYYIRVSLSFLLISSFLLLFFYFVLTKI